MLAPWLAIASFLAVAAMPVASADAHLAGIGGDDHGYGLLWFYGALMLAMFVYVVHRKRRASESPRRRELQRELRELQRALDASNAKLRHARDYPNECGLTYQQHLEQVGLIDSLKKRIAETESELAAA